MTYINLQKIQIYEKMSKPIIFPTKKVSLKIQETLYDKVSAIAKKQ